MQKYIKIPKKFLIENKTEGVVFRKNNNIRKLTPIVMYVRTRMEKLKFFTTPVKIAQREACTRGYAEGLDK
jgi:hypothetical protein